MPLFPRDGYTVGENNFPKIDGLRSEEIHNVCRVTFPLNPKVKLCFRPF